MNFLTILATLPIIVAMLLNPVSSGTAIQDQCAAEAKDALYKSFLANRTSDQAKAFEDAKKYLACPAAAQPTEAETKIIDYLKKWSKAYDDASRRGQLPQLLYNDKKYVEAYALGSEILAAEPENLKVLVDLGANGYLVLPLKNPTLQAQAVGYATKALQLLESGKTLEDWKPLTGKDVALAYLNYTIGTLTLEKDPGGALKPLIKAAQFETPLKKSPFTYAYIAGAYETGPYAKQSDDYKRLYSGKDETPESKLALANINQIVDRMIDGYARAVALAGSDPKFATPKTAWKESLTTWYKFRNNNTDTGLDALINSVLSKPLPPEPTAVTSLPESTPSPSPSTSPSPSASPSATPSMSPSASPKPSSKPSPSASPTPTPKPTPRPV